MLAINRERADMRDELLRRGARIGLLEALILGDDARVERFLREDGLPAITPNGGSILAFATTPFAIDRLIALGAPTDMADRWGSTPIDAMSRAGSRGQALVDHLAARGVRASPREYARLGDIARLSRLVDTDPPIARNDSAMLAAVGIQPLRPGSLAARARRQRERPRRRPIASDPPAFGCLERGPGDGTPARRGRRGPERARRTIQRHTAGLGEDVNRRHEQRQV
jgi:hypothetical protein